MSSATVWAVVCGLTLGTGLLLVVRGLSQNTPAREVSRHSLAMHLHQLGVDRMNSSVFLLLSFICGALIAGAILLLTSVIAVALVAFIAGSALPFVWLKARAVRRASIYAGVWPDVVDALITQMRSGATIPSALNALVMFPQTLVAEGATVFARCFGSTGNADLALNDLKASWGQAASDRIIESLRVARDVGGSHVIATLAELGAQLRAENLTRRDIQAKQSWVAVAARIGVAAPWIVLIVLSFRPEAVAAYNSSAGVLIILGGFIACILAYRLMLSIGALPTDRRNLS